MQDMTDAKLDWGQKAPRNELPVQSIQIINHFVTFLTNLLNEIYAVYFRTRQTFTCLIVLLRHRKPLLTRVFTSHTIRKFKPKQQTLMTC